MVEMRWIERDLSSPCLPSATIIVDKDRAGYKVLQYRYKLDIDRRVSEIWSEWIDVPTVTEG